MPFAGALLVGLATLHPPLFRALVAEDSLLEWGEFAAYAAASLLGLLIGRRLSKAGRRVAAVGYLLLALGCFFVAGEEISWGQRVFGLEAPASLKTINSQDEITIHNLSAAETGFRLLLLSIGLYGSAAAWLSARWSRRWPTDVVNLVVPPLFATSLFLVLFGYNLTRLLLFPEPSYTVAKFSEWPEFCLALGLLIFAFLNWRRLRSRAGGRIVRL